MSEVTGRQSRPFPVARFAILALVLGAVALLVVFASRTPGTTSQGDGYFAQRISAASEKSVARFPLELKEGAVEHESSHIFEVLASVRGVATAKILTAGPNIEVGFDTGAVSEDTIRKALTDAGYVGGQAAGQK